MVAQGFDKLQAVTNHGAVCRAQKGREHQQDGADTVEVLGMCGSVEASLSGCMGLVLPVLGTGRWGGVGYSVTETSCTGWAAVATFGMIIVCVYFRRRSCCGSVLLGVVNYS